nr:Ribonuclease H, related [Medicago truncatula]
MLVLLAFKSVSMVPWSVRNRWDNYVAITRQMNFIVPHVFKEGNCCAHRSVWMWFTIKLEQISLEIGLEKKTFIWSLAFGHTI